METLTTLPATKATVHTSENEAPVRELRPGALDRQSVEPQANVATTRNVAPPLVSGHNHPMTGLLGVNAVCGRRRSKIAPLRRRLRAAVIDAWRGLSIGGLGLTLGGLAASPGLKALGPDVDDRLRRLVERFQPRNDDGEVSTPWDPQIKLRYRLLMSTASLVTAVVGRNHRSLGKRKMGLRRVELRTGAQVTVRAALVHWGASTLWERLVNLVFRPVERRAAQRSRGLQEELKEIRRRHPDDDHAQQMEVMRVYKERQINPLASCGWTLGRIVVTQAPILITPRHQNIPDLIAGLVVIEQ